MRIKEQFRGTGQVFRFTLTQLFKSKSNRIAMVLMLFLTLVSMPLMTLIKGGDGTKNDEKTEVICLDNRTALDLSGLEEYLRQNEGYPEIRVLENAAPEGTERAVSAVLEMTEEGLSLNITQPEGGSRSDTWRIASLLYRFTEQARLKDAGFREEAAAVLSGDIIPNAYYYGEISGEADEVYYDRPKEISETDYTRQIGYSIVLMMFCVYSISYIIRAVVEEKSSRLADLLLVSVKPAALLLGKVLAVLVFVVIYMMIIIGGMLLSNRISSLIFHTSAVPEMLSGLFSVRLSAGTLTVILVTSILGYFAFGLLSGLCGAGCSAMEETGGAMTTCMLLIMAGYMISIMSFMAGDGTKIILSMIPVLSMFMLPVSYMNGIVGAAGVIVSWLLQILCIIVLIWLSARVYSRLIIYNGRRLKLSEIIKLAGKEES